MKMDWPRKLTLEEFKAIRYLKTKKVPIKEIARMYNRSVLEIEEFWKEE